MGGHYEWACTTQNLNEDEEMQSKLNNFLNLNAILFIF